MPNATASRPTPHPDHPLAGPTPIVAVVGQTATGKSDLGLALADRVPVRFEVSRDSRTSTIERVRA